MRHSGEANLTTYTSQEARSQMAHLLGSQVDWSKLETGGKGTHYVKVWRDKPVALLLWFWFTPETERIAYERAVQAMADNPGARWAVSGACSGECAGLPKMLGFDFFDGELPDLAHVALGELYAAKSRGLIIETHDDGTYLMLADHGYAFEAEPSKWHATDAGKRYVEAKQDAARVAKLGSLADG
jgi:hypothetical protein